MTDTTSTVNALEAALEAAADGDMVGSLLDPRDLAAFVVKTLIALGAVMPDGAAKLRARVDELETTVSILEDSDPFSYDDCRDDCDGCHEGMPMCDCHVPATEARTRIRDLRDRVEHAEEQVADALALCTEIRPDSVIGTSVEARLGLVRDRLAMPATTHRLDPATTAPRWVGSEPQEADPSCACGSPWAEGKCAGGGDRG